MGTFVPIGDASGIVRWRNCRRPGGRTRLDTARRGLGTVDCRAAARSRQSFSLPAVPQGKCHFLSRGLMPLQKYEREFARGKAPAGLENNRA